MGMYEFEHLRLLCYNLTEALILFLSIGMEVAGKCVHVFLMVKAHLLNIKGDGIKALR